MKMPTVFIYFLIHRIKLIDLCPLYAKLDQNYNVPYFESHLGRHLMLNDANISDITCSKTSKFSHKVSIDYKKAIHLPN